LASSPPGGGLALALAPAPAVEVVVLAPSLDLLCLDGGLYPLP